MLLFIFFFFFFFFFFFVVVVVCFLLFFFFFLFCFFFFFCFFLAKNIICGYTLERSNQHPQSMFWNRNKKKCSIICNSSTRKLKYKHLQIRRSISEPPHGKTNNLHRRKQRPASLISAFVFATRIVKFLLYLTPKFQPSSLLLLLYSLICVRPVRKPQCWFFHEVAQIYKP